MAANESARVFRPRDLTNDQPTFALPNELWLSMLECTCTFSSEDFTRVMLNLIKNPNITSSHLFRADIFYDSYDETSFTRDPQTSLSNDFTKYMKKDYQPISATLPGWSLERTIVRQMVPRNPQLDRPLVQTCHFFRAIGSGPVKEELLVLQIPHVSSPENIPWYHPAVRSVAFLYTPEASDGRTSKAAHATISVHYSPFPNTYLDTRLTRTALNLLRTLHKHGQGQQAGYQKRVNHDLIIPQARFQNRYAELKAKHAKRLIGEWSEQTDPTKHVFEDLGIAAFLIELWHDMYGTVSTMANGTVDEPAHKAHGSFPGFVDIGCGNGVLVYVLLQEGYQGWGFDARRRKTWSTFPTAVQKHLKEMLLVPSIFPREPKTENQPTQPASQNQEDIEIAELTVPISQLRVANGLLSKSIECQKSNPIREPSFPDGLFPIGTFIISNHADELTAWTPLLAYLCDSPFIAIPCCSHNLAGARFRAPAHPANTRCGPTETGPVAEAKSSETLGEMHNENTDKTGTLAKPKGPNQPSAYASLCAYVESLAGEVGYQTEREMLRIPSTRNAAIIGRICLTAADDNGEYDKKESTSVRQKWKEAKVCGIVERELGMSVGAVGEAWIERAVKLAGSKGKSH